MTHLAAHSLWVAHATLKDPASTSRRFAALHKAAVAACDARGRRQGRRARESGPLRFDPESLQCRAATEAAGA